MRTLILTFCLAVLVNLSANCQQDEMKFGKIDMDELTMTVYQKDTTANAVVLGDYGNVFFKYNISDGNWYLYFERHRRIKILKKPGYDWANHEIFLYDHEGVSEKVSSLERFFLTISPSRRVTGLSRISINLTTRALARVDFPAPESPVMKTVNPCFDRGG